MGLVMKVILHPMYLSRRLLLSTLRCISTTVTLADGLIILKQGKLKGHCLTSRAGREIFAYEGIPYAQPPVGELRFKPPRPPQPWEGILNAVKYGPPCTQRNFFKPYDDIIGQEDCLYLNVYTPQKPGVTTDKPLDVMFWIHGGAWISGSGSSDSFGPQYLLDHDIVLVTINYRLGILGFLSTGNSECPGNNGLKDQVAGLIWVQNNIGAFGGNPNSVTIFGESAGGASVHYHMMSPLSKGLFHRAISQSGTALTIWAHAPKGSTAHLTEKLATILNCPKKPTDSLMQCLREKDSTEIQSKDKYFMKWKYDLSIPFNVVKETESQNEKPFLTTSPREAIENCIKKNELVPWMMGINSGEGAYVIAHLLQRATIMDTIDQTFEECILRNFFIDFIKDHSYVVKIDQCIRKYYFGDCPISRENILSLRDMFTDSLFLYGAHQAVELHSQKSPVYYYYFDYKGSNSYSTIHGDLSDYGVCHQDELQYLFPQNHLFKNSTISDNDESMIKLLTSLWTYFAQTGKPTDSANGWQAYSSTNPVYAHITSNGLCVKRDLLVGRVNFWTSIL